MIGGHVHDCNVDVRSELLLGCITEATLLQAVTQFGCGHDPWYRLAKTDGGRHRQLGEVVEIGRHIGATVGGGNVGLGTPDNVVGTLHHRLIGAVHSDVFAKNQSILKAFEDVLKRDPFFFRK